MDSVLREGKAVRHECGNTNTVCRSRSKAGGFTLIELMIVVVIVAILAAIALPSYSNYIRRGQLQEAFTHLADYRAKMEQYYQDNKNYGTGGVCANAATASTWNGFVPTGLNPRYFDYGCVLAPDGQSYSLTAGGAAGQPTVGYAYRINQDGLKETTMFAGAASTETCWLSRSATSC